MLIKKRVRLVSDIINSKNYTYESGSTARACVLAFGANMHAFLSAPDRVDHHTIHLFTLMLSGNVFKYTFTNKYNTNEIKTADS